MKWLIFSLSFFLFQITYGQWEEFKLYTRKDFGLNGKVMKVTNLYYEARTKGNTTVKGRELIQMNEAEERMDDFISFDTGGRLISETYGSYEYDTRGRLVKQEYSGWESHSVYYYTYDENNFIKEKIDTTWGEGVGEIYLSEFKCDEKGKILEIYKDRLFVGDYDFGVYDDEHDIPILKTKFVYDKSGNKTGVYNYSGDLLLYKTIYEYNSKNEVTGAKEYDTLNNVTKDWNGRPHPVNKYAPQGKHDNFDKHGNWTRCIYKEVRISEKEIILERKIEYYK
jgi:hypothetical protein